jgi:hypothetical protein
MNFTAAIRLNNFLRQGQPNQNHLEKNKGKVKKEERKEGLYVTLLIT